MNLKRTHADLNLAAPTQFAKKKKRTCRQRCGASCNSDCQNELSIIIRYEVKTESRLTKDIDLMIAGSKRSRMSSYWTRASKSTHFSRDTVRSVLGTGRYTPGTSGKRSMWVATTCKSRAECCR